MVRKSYTAEQIINKLREAAVFLGQGATVGGASHRMRAAEVEAQLAFIYPLIAEASIPNKKPFTPQSPA